MPPLDRRATLLAHNAGVWEGTFVRFDGQGREQERFASHLEVLEREGTIEAALTNGSSGQVRRMAFQEPPAEMQIAPPGHWSLGPDRIGAWPWVAELCLVAGPRRRRVVVRHGGEGLELLVVVVEGRPGVEREPPAPWALTSRLLPAGGEGQPPRRLWCPDPSLEIETVEGRRGQGPERVRLCWHPAGGEPLSLSRAYGPYGNLLPLGEDGPG